MTERPEKKFEASGDPPALPHDGRDAGVVDPSTLSPAARVRAIADEEVAVPSSLTDAEAGQVAFERSLREHVARAMHEPSSAPPALHDRVASILAAGAASAGEDAAGKGDAASPPEIRTLGSSDRSFWSGGPRLWMSIAAAVLLVASAGVLFNVVGLPEQPAGQQSLAEATPIINGVPRSQLVGFMTREHDRCATLSPEVMRKLSITSLDGACAAATEYFGAPINAAELLANDYTFAGYGRCGVPGGGKSVHLVYKPRNASLQPISLFIQEDRGGCRLEEGRTYVVACEESPSPLFVWRREGLIFYLVSPQRMPAESTPTQLGAPSERVEI
jgi:hypothetical protein